MENLGQYIIYGIAAIIYIIITLYNSNKKKVVANPHQVKTQNKQETQPKTTFSVEEFIRQLDNKQPSKSADFEEVTENKSFEKSQFESVESFKEIGAYNDDIKAQLEDKFDFQKSFGELKEINKLKRAKNPYEDEKESYISSVKKAKPQKLTKEQIQVVEINKYKILMQNPENIKNAFILGEILQRKF